MPHLLRRYPCNVCSLASAIVFFASLALMMPTSVIAQDEVVAQETVETLELPAPAGEDAVAEADGLAVEQVAGTLVIDNARTGLVLDTLISAGVPGVVEKIHVAPGKVVKANEPLVKLKSELAETKVMAAEAALQAANMKHENDISLRYARRKLQLVELEAKQGVVANEVFPGVVSEMDLQKAELKVDLAKLELEQVEADRKLSYAQLVQSEANLFSARANAERQLIRTSVAGTIAEVTVAPGESVGGGEPLVRIISLDPLRVEGFLEASQYAPGLVGRAVTFIPSGAAGDVKLVGRVTYVSPELHPVTGQVLLRASVANPGQRVVSGALGKMIID